MGEFSYQGVNRQGKRIEGKLAAANEGEARMLLRGQGVRPTRIGAVGVLDLDVGNIFSIFSGRGSIPSISLKSLSMFTRQLHVLITSGIPLTQALELLADQAPDANLKRLITIVKEKVSQGSFLWESLNAYNNALPRIYVPMIRAGEASGNLDIVLERLSKFLDRAYALARLVRGAMVYPIMVTVVALGVVTLMLTMVVPKFEEILKGAKQELPAPTRILIDMSHWLTGNFIYVITAALVGGYFAKQYAKSKEGRAVIHQTMFKMPLFGELMQKAGISRFSRTLSTLVGSGVTLTDSVDICRATVDNYVLEEAVGKIRREVESGKSLSSIMGRLPAFPKMSVQMVSVGESTGSLDKMLDKIADIYEADVETLVTGMSKLFEPIMLVILGGIVGAILIAMYLPIFKLAGGAGE